MQTQIVEMDVTLHIHLLSQTGFDQVDRPQQEIHALFAHQVYTRTMRQHQQHAFHIEATERKQAQRNAMTQTQIMEMDAILHVHLWSQAGFDQAGQLLQVTHVLFCTSGWYQNDATTPTT